MSRLHLSPLELAELRAFILYSAREGDGVHERAPRALAAKGNEVLRRLGLPPQPPAPPYWFEAAFEGGIA